MSTSIKWATEQLESSGLPEQVQRITLILLDELNDAELTLEDISLVTKAFSSLARTESILPDEEDSVWEPVQRGFIRTGDTVRIKKDAFTGKSGEIQNGRVCRVVSIRSGDIILRSIDEKDFLIDGVHYAPEVLEKKVN